MPDGSGVAMPNVAVPAATTVRRRLRQARRGHHSRPRGEVLTDLYILFWVFIVYGGVLVYALRDYVEIGGGPVADRFWLGVSALAVAMGLLWAGLRALGPLAVGAAEQAGCLSTPVDRPGWLLPRLAATVAVGVAATAALTVPAAVVVTGDGPGWGALAALSLGVSAVGLGVMAQAARSGARWPRVPALVLAGGGLLCMAGLVIARSAGAALPAPVDRPLRAVALGALPLMGLALAGALRALPGLDRAALGRGAGVVGAAATATLALDPSVLTQVLAVRRWRRIGRVRSRPFRPLPANRVGVLVAAELRRLGRRRSVLAVAAGLALVQVALAIALPRLGGPARVVGAYVVGLSLASGLGAVSRSPGLRRSLGGSDWTVRAAHLVVPALGILVWWAATALAGTAAGAGDLGVLPLILAATYRGATRPAMRYDGMVIETPFGPLPVDLIRQILRGPDLLGGVLVAQFLLQS